jgi:hypothetical protein
MNIINLDGGEVVTISEYRQIYDELMPDQDGNGYFIKNSTELTDDEITTSKVFNSDYIAENQYSHIAWYSN